MNNNDRYRSIYQLTHRSILDRSINALVSVDISADRLVIVIVIFLGQGGKVHEVIPM